MKRLSPLWNRGFYVIAFLIMGGCIGPFDCNPTHCDYDGWYFPDHPKNGYPCETPGNKVSTDGGMLCRCSDDSFQWCDNPSGYWWCSPEDLSVSDLSTPPDLQPNDDLEPPDDGATDAGVD